MEDFLGGYKYQNRCFRITLRCLDCVNYEIPPKNRSEAIRVILLLLTVVSIEVTQRPLQTGL